MQHPLFLKPDPLMYASKESRYMVDTDIFGNIPRNNCSGTARSPAFMKAPTASRPWIFWAGSLA